MASDPVPSFDLPDRVDRRPIGMVRVAPQRVGEDAHRPARGSDVLNLAAGEPVVDGAPAHAHELTSLHDRDRFSLHLAACLRGLYRTSSRISTGTVTRLGGAIRVLDRRPRLWTGGV